MTCFSRSITLIIAAFVLSAAGIDAHTQAPIHEALEVLWEGVHTRLVLLDGQLAVMASRKAGIGELADDEILELEHTVGKMQTIFQEVFGFGDFCRWMPCQGDYVISFLYPAGAAAAATEFSALFKTKVMLATLNEETHLLAALQPEKIACIVSTAQRILPEISRHVLLPEISFSTTGIQEAFELLKIRSGESGLQRAEQVPHLSRLSRHCRVFCSPAVIETEQLCTSTDNYVLPNLNPYTTLHFMIIPKKHRTAPSESTDLEIIDKYRLVDKITTVARQHFSHKKMGVMTRVGCRGGQTQPHLHDHVVSYEPGTIQDWMTNWARDMAGAAPKHPWLDEKDIRDLRGNWGPLLSTETVPSKNA